MWSPKYEVGDRVVANTGKTEADNHGWRVARIIESICEYELQHETGPGICFVRDEHIRGLAPSADERPCEHCGCDAGEDHDERCPTRATLTVNSDTDVK